MTSAHRLSKLYIEAKFHDILYIMWGIWNGHETLAIFDNKCPLPWTCDEFHRQETYVLRIFSFSTLLYFDFVFIYFPVVLFNSLVALLKRMNGQFLFSFSSPENVEKV